MEYSNISEKWKKIYSYTLIFSIVLNVYTYVRFNISYGEILLFLLMPFLIPRVHKIKLNSAGTLYILFIVYAIIVTIINIMLFSQIDIAETVKRLVRDGFYIVIICVFSKEFFDYKYAIKALNILSVVLSVYIIIQFLAYLVFGLYIPGLINGLPIGELNATEYKMHILKMAAIDGFLRPTGFLREPSHCAQLLSISLLLNFIPCNGDVSKKRVILYTLALLFTTSTNAIIFIATTYMLCFWYYMKSRIRRARTNALFIGIAVIFLFVSAYINVPFIQSVAGRLLSIGSQDTSSSSLRVLRGIAFFAAMPSISKFFGIGFGNFLGYREALNISTRFEVISEYMSMDIYVITSAGIIGTIILLSAIHTGLKGKQFYNKALMILLLVIGISSSIYSSILYAIALSFVFFDRGEAIGVNKMAEEAMG